MKIRRRVNSLDYKRRRKIKLKAGVRTFVNLTQTLAGKSAFLMPHISIAVLPFATLLICSMPTPLKVALVTVWGVPSICQISITTIRPWSDPLMVMLPAPGPEPGKQTELATDGKQPVTSRFGSKEPFSVIEPAVKLKLIVSGVVDVKSNVAVPLSAESNV